MYERSSLLVFGFLGMLAMGCSKETTSSRNIRTNGIAALIDVYADTDTTATVHVELRVGGSSSNVYIGLDDGDQLTATAGDQKKTLTTTDEVGVYEANFSGVGAETAFGVVLDRPRDTSAPANSGTLPPPFTLDKPTDDLSRKDDELEVTWSPSGTEDGMDFEFDGPCIFSLKTSPPDDSGSFILAKDTLDSTDDDKPERCKIKLNAQRSRSGSADGEFDNESYFRLHQRRSTTFVSAP